MMPVDGTRIRRQVKVEYERVMEEVADARRQLERFEHADLPAFSRWVHRQFGALLTELREVAGRLGEQERLLTELENEMFFHGASPRTAFARIMRRRSQAEQAGAESARAGPEQERPEDSAFREAAEQEFEEERSRRAAPRARRQSRSAGRLKELYRAVVRRLHPDAQKEMTPQKLEWWHQAQAAYRQGEAGQLEVILTLCEIEEQGSLEKVSVSILQRMTTEFRKTLRHLKGEITQRRRDPAWNFSQRTDTKELAREMRRQLEHDLRLMREELQMMEMQLAAWTAETRRGAPRARHFAGPFVFHL